MRYEELKWPRSGLVDPDIGSIAGAAFAQGRNVWYSS